MARRVVITGLGAVSPLGIGASTLFDRWAAGESGIVDGEGACADFDATDHLSKKEIRRHDRFCQLGMVAGSEAVADAWGEEHPFDPERVGCIIGTGIGGLVIFEAQHEVLLTKGPKAMSPLGIPMLMGNAAAAAISMRHELKGPTYATVSACAAGAHALGDALRLIQCGDADAVVAGGTEATLTPFARASFGSMGALSPTGISRPFDARRDGFVMGEGAAALVLESYEAAQARGARILAELRGYASTADAFHLTAPEPTGAVAARAIKLALKDADAAPGDVAYVNAHGTSTPLNDLAETNALKTALGEDEAKRIPVSSTKSAIGHLLGAGGAVEAVATVLTLHHGVIPPTLGYSEPDPELDLDYVPGEARPLRPRNGGPPLALSNSFGFGGHNVVLAFAGANGASPAQ
ncbi:MAG TPA: beta-ketoacyl-[acyl-carrier-protein] synthase II [Solirubrobacteraceae bacterium]